MKCRECRRKKSNRPRGLCWSCYYRPGVRESHGTDEFHRPDLIHGRPETMADLDELERHQRANLPKWWPRETAEQLEADRPKPMTRLGAAYLRGATGPGRGQRQNGRMVIG